jgi:glutathione synthase/RimK-type ligase-like ATP-grasp enzyme
MSVDGAIVIVGAETDDHVRAVRERLAGNGLSCRVLDPLAFPQTLRLSLGSEVEDVRVGGEPLLLPRAVYVRSVYASPDAFGVEAEQEMARDWRKTLAIHREKGAMFGALLQRWEAAGVALYNPPSAAHRVNKPYQLALLRDAGLPVPDSLWSNDPDQVRCFAKSRRTVYKPIAGGAPTRELKPADLAPERLAALANAPVTFQELLPGEDVRVYVLGGRVVASLRIDSPAIDFRQQEEAVTPISLPREVEEQCLSGARLLGQRFTGMDLKRDSSGTLRILELNSSPMFLGFDELAGCDLLGALCESLAGHAL